MRRILGTLMAGLMVATVSRSLAQPVAAPPATLLVNGAFTEGLASWRVESATADAVQVDNADSMSPPNGLRIAHADDTLSSSAVQAVTLAPNSTYTLSHALKTDGIPAGKGARVMVREAVGGQLLLSGLPQATEGRWQSLAVSFQTRNAAAVEVVLALNKTQGKAWFDDVAITAVGAPAPAAGVAGATATTLENVAKGKSYTFSIPPNYSYCADPDDKTQLTDGVLTSGYFWTQKTTVGWSSTLVGIDLDLSQVLPIRGLSYSTAAGVADVGWPESISVLVSDDGKAYYFAGDLVALAEGGRPAADGGYRTFTFRTQALQTKGRYVRLAICPSGGNYLFCDEIEVYRGDDAWLAKQPTTRPIPGDQFNFAFRWCKRMNSDLGAMKDRLAAATVPDAAKAELGAQLEEVGKALDGFTFTGDPKSFRAILPFDDAHRRLFALHGRILAAEGFAPLTVWHKYRYAQMALLERPSAKDVPSLDLRMMRNEHRAEVLNLTNAAPEPMRATVQITGLPSGDNPPYVSVYQVEYVDTRENKVVADALVELKAENGVFTTTVPAGMTRQIWFSFFPGKDVAPGKHQGTVVVRQGDAVTSVPFTLNLVAGVFPDRTDLTCGLWDYADGPAYGMTLQNREMAIRDMKAHYVTLALGSGKVKALPAADGVDADGNLTKPLDFTGFDEWLKLWPDAPYYQIYYCVLPNSTFAGKKRGTEPFNRAMKQWAEAWDKHAREVGLTQGRLQFAFLDEPGNQEAYETSRQWTEAFKAGSKEIAVFIDPQLYGDFMNYVPQALESGDILCPLLAQYTTGSDELRQMFQGFRAKGKQLWFYMAHGPNRLFDPSYFRLHFWYCYRYGATGAGFWAYGDTGGVPSNWNEYVAEKGTSYSLPYLAPDSVTPSKHWEAFREGIEDNQYLRLLAARGDTGKQLAAQLAEDATVRTETITRKDPRLPWCDNTPCAFADDARLKALDMLEKTEPAK
ncbi:MAG: hypothetical protein A3K19_04930 [Lentisphaerae bacterium RIFOXYB12_FULL_65_16]|nr:MAG: hypothetical protein A3K18_35130 [Lentisphaerae bacterium RIFOXYA12_64_32]OGV89735.1 MAG: hypothetical protein A3K19_04930 [Lentisphaerae bacterium RIFOXYB12_FULL_65_16]